MTEKIYRIRQAFLIPLTLDGVLLFMLIITSLVTESHPTERIVLVLFFVPLMCFIVEARMRTIMIIPDGLTLKKFFKTKHIRWNDITNVDTVLVGKKAYLAMTTIKGFYVISNSYEKFSHLVGDIVGQLDSGRVEERVRTVVDRPPVKRSDVVAAWGVALLMAAILYVKIFVA
jgi:hypothetical protein